MLQTRTLLFSVLLAVLGLTSAVSALPDLNNPRLVIDSHQAFDIPAGAVVAEVPHDLHARDSFLEALNANSEAVREAIVEVVNTDKAAKDWLQVIGARDTDVASAERAAALGGCKTLGAKCRKDQKCCQGACVKKHTLSVYGVCAYV